jgi:hypothetical protein
LELVQSSLLESTIFLKALGDLANNSGKTRLEHEETSSLLVEADLLQSFAASYFC